VAENPLIIANGYLLCCDPGNHVGRYHLLVRDGRIQEIGGTLETLITLNPGATVVDASARLIIPGLVNAHYHTLSFLLHELTAGKPFSSWKNSRSLRSRTESFLEPGNAEQLRFVTLGALLASVKSGITCVGELPPPVEGRGFDLLLDAAGAVGIRSVMMLQNWAQITRVREEKASQHRLMISLGREEDYTVYSFENYARAAKELGCPLVVHAGELREDVDLVRKNFLKSLCTLFRDFGVLRPSTLLIHMNHGGKDDARPLTESRATVALCPASAVRKQSGYPFLRMLGEYSSRLCLGTDWGSVDLFTEMRLLRALPKLFAGMPVFSSLDVLRMATINGAVALGLEEEIGSIEVGKRADLTFLALDDIRVVPPRDGWNAGACAELVIGTFSSHDVADVMVDGRFVVRGGRGTLASEEEIITGFREIRETVLSGEERYHEPPRMAGSTATHAVRAKIYTFATGERTQTAEGEDFVEGFTVVKTPSHEGLPEKENPPSSDPQQPPSIPRPMVQPELSKNVKKVFGEDEDL
jgi:5-methylthioadenosine/S-adenosylhomocysteine deaminase